MFGRKKQVQKPAAPDPARPEAEAACGFMELAANEDLHAAMQLLASGKYTDEVWTEVLMIYVLVAHIVPEVRDHFDDWVQNSPERRQPGLQKVTRAVDELRVEHLDHMDREVAMFALTGLAMAIGASDEGSRRLLWWSVSGTPQWTHEIDKA